MMILPRCGSRPTFDRLDGRGSIPLAPSWQGESSRRRLWSVQPCVRPLSAVHMTAGHKALRGSGPGQNLAFNDAVARGVVLIAGSTGSALRAVRSPNVSHHATITRRDPIKPSARVDNCTARPWPSSPRPFGRACWQARWLQLWLVAEPARL